MGRCACPGGSTLCGTACTLTQFDRNNCGACGTVCPGGQRCFNGTCR
jgi:hypothetical protein